MSMTQNNGGPAFPYANPDYDGNWTTEKMIPGMSLRDWFAGMAITPIEWRIGTFDADEIAARCYQLADAMLAARKEQP